MRLTSFAAVILFSATSILAGVNRWTAGGPGIGRVIQAATDTTNGSSVYARTSSGIYRSDDGMTWRAVNDGLPNPGVIHAFVVTPIGLFASIENTVYMSGDAGEHWLRRGSAGSVSIAGLAFDLHTQTLLAGTTDSILYSVDAGKTWVAASTPEGMHGMQTVVASSNVAMSMASTSSGASVALRSADGGRTWQNGATGPYSLYADPSSASIYGTVWQAGNRGQLVYVSNDGGQTFTKISSPPVYRATALVVAGPQVYALSQAGVYVLYPNTSRWSRIGSSIDIYSMAVLQNSTRLFAATDRGVVVLQAGKADWIPANDGLPRSDGFDVATADAEPGRAFAATDDGVLRTEDAGGTWSPMHVEARSLAFNPNSADVAYAVGSKFMETTDGGATWNRLTANVTQLAIARSDPSTLYAVFADSLAKSTNGGQTWASIMHGIPESFLYVYSYASYDSFEATSLAVDPNDASTAYVCGPALYKTTDGGANWNSLAAMPNLRSLTVDPHDSATLFATAWPVGVVRSRDAGRTWTSAGLIDKNILALSGDGSRLFAGSDDGHLYRSDDGGDSWRGFDEGLGRGAVNRIAPNGNLVYAATAGGIYEYQFVESSVRPERLTTSVRLPGDTESGFIFPVIGVGHGAGGTAYTTDVTLMNARDVAQKFLVTWIPDAAGAETPASFALTIPAGGTSITDISAQFGISGIGSLAFVPVDDAGDADGNASVDGSARIWTDPGGGRAPIAQTMAAARGAALSDYAQLALGGLRSDADFRLNAGIVNLSNESRQFTIQINGTLASDQITITVPALSLVQVALPERDFGDVQLLADAGVPARWLLYVSVVDRVTHGSQTFLAAPLQPLQTPTEEVWIRGNVIDGATRLCINHAVVQVVGDPRPSSRTTNECGQLFSDNFLITGMQAGAHVILRASADGYLTKDFPNVVGGDIDDPMFVTFSLEKQQ